MGLEWWELLVGALRAGHGVRWGCGVSLLPSRPSAAPGGLVREGGIPVEVEVPGEEDLHCHVGVGSLAPLNALPCSAHRKTQLVSLWTEDARFAELCDASFCRGCTEKQTWGTAGLKGEE